MLLKKYYEHYFFYIDISTIYEEPCRFLTQQKICNQNYKKQKLKNVENVDNIFKKSLNKIVWTIVFRLTIEMHKHLMKTSSIYESIKVIFFLRVIQKTLNLFMSKTGFVW